MGHLIWAKIQAGISIISIILGWFFAQFPNFELTFDEILSISLLGIAVVTIWRAFLAKDKSETQILKDQIQLKDDQIEVLNKTIKHLEDHIDTLKNGFK